MGYSISTVRMPHNIALMQGDIGDLALALAGDDVAASPNESLSLIRAAAKERIRRLIYI